MQKLNKDQTQKLVLSGIFFAALIYGYFQFMLGPLTTKETANKAAIVSAKKEIEEARRQIKVGKNTSESAVPSANTLTSIEGMIPKEAVIAWFPPLVTRFFSSHSIPKVTLALRGTEVVPGEGLERFKYFSWDVTFPPGPALETIDALSQFENEMPLLAIRSIKIDASAGTPEAQRIICEFKTLLK